MVAVRVDYRHKIKTIVLIAYKIYVIQNNKFEFESHWYARAMD